MDKKRSTLAANLKRLRELQGLSQSALSRASGVNQSTIARIESDECSPTFGVIAVLRDALGCSAADLLDPAKKAAKASKRA